MTKVRSHRMYEKPRTGLKAGIASMTVGAAAVLVTLSLSGNSTPASAYSAPLMQPAATPSPGDVAGCAIDGTHTLNPAGEVVVGGTWECNIGPMPVETTTETVTAPGTTFTTTVTETKTVTVTPPPTTPPPTTPPATGWPNASNTGVPAGVTLTAYTGPCTITVANTVIDSKTVNCTLSIRANNVTIRNSRINGSIENGTGAQPSRSFTVTDSDIINAVNTTGIGESYFTATRVDISGGNRGANCFTDCTVRDSYIHGNRITGTTHASGLRAGMNTTYIHNYLICTVGGNCSADLTGYADFSPTHHWTITNNFFGGVTDAQWCAYDGAVGGKPYSGDPTNATYIQFRDNVFARGPSGKCGQAAPVAFDGASAKVGWVFTNNRFEDGALIPGP